METIAVNPFCDYEPDGGAQSAGGLRVSDKSFQWVILQRQRLRPLHVCTRILFQINNYCVGLPIWSDLALHETINGRFVCYVTHYLSESLGGTWCDTWLHDSVALAQQAIFEHDPAIALADLPGDPSMTAPRVAEMAERIALVEMFRGAWFGMVRAILGRRVR